MNLGLTNNNPLTVSQLTREIKGILEDSFERITLEAELSNFRPASSGHWYFSLKDDNAVIQGVMFRGHNSKVAFTPRDGMQILVQGELSLYEKRGSYQLICNTMQEAGLGQILRALEERKRHLAAEGLFDEARKKRIPLFPKRIGVITSPTGAAIRDILHVLKRRSTGASVIILPAAVQGKDAALQLSQMVAIANQFEMADVLIISRGGGSLEDLLPFSEEILVRSIAQSAIPIISAVGHEIDWSLSDYAADLRAPTPSAAAEIVTAHQEEMEQRVLQAGHFIAQALVNIRSRLKLALKPFRIEYIEEAFRRFIQPRYQRLDDAKEELLQSFGRRLESMQRRLSVAKAQIESCSPFEVLHRGYAIVQKEHEPSFVRSAGSLSIDERLIIRFSEGRVKTQVIDIVSEDDRNE